MCLIQAKGWDHQSQQQYFLILNVEQITRITQNADGRAVVNMTDGNAVVLDEFHEFMNAVLKA